MHPECVLEHPHVGPAVLAEPATHAVPTEAADQVADPATKEGRAAVREWAEDHGYEPKPTGPLSKEVLDAYAAAHPARAREQGTP